MYHNVTNLVSKYAPKAVMTKKKVYQHSLLDL